MIEKKFYYYWNTDNIPDMVKICIETWKYFNPDFEIERIPESYVDMNLEWNQKAFKKKSWTLLSDAVRINFLKTHSGIYIDTDMFAIKKFPEELLNNDFIFDVENINHYNNAIIGKSNTDYGNYVINEWYNIFKQHSYKILHTKTILDKLIKSINIEKSYFLNRNFAEILAGIHSLELNEINDYKFNFTNSVFLHMNTSLKRAKDRKNQNFVFLSSLNYLKDTNCNQKIIELFKEYNNLLCKKSKISINIDNYNINDW